MNILVFSWRDPKHPNAGGAEQVMHEHMKGWVEAGHKVTLFSSRVKGLPSEEVLDGIKIIRKGDQYVGVKIAAFFYWQKNKDSYDFVVDQFHGIPFFTPLYVRKPKLAVLQEVAKRVWFLNELPFPFNWIIGLLGYLTEPVIFLFYEKVPFISKKQTMFMTGSNSARADLVKMGIFAKNITVVPHGIILPPHPTSYILHPTSVPTVTFLGALAKDKGIEDALKAFSIISKGKKEKFRFWVIGQGSPRYQAYLASLSRRLGISGETEFFGFVSEQKKFELLARSHLLVNPSAHEGWGLVNIEANSVSTPVVSYNSAGLIDSVSNNVSGVVVKKNNPEELAKVVEQILKDGNYYHILQEGAIRWSRNFSWEKSRVMSLKLIKRVVRTDN